MRNVSAARSGRFRLFLQLLGIVHVVVDGHPVVDDGAMTTAPGVGHAFSFVIAMPVSRAARAPKDRASAFL